MWNQNREEVTASGTGTPVKHGRVFLVPWKKDTCLLSSVHVYTSVNWTSHFLQGTRKLITLYTEEMIWLKGIHY